MSPVNTEILSISPFKVSDIIDAASMVRSTWAFGEIASEAGRAATAAHYVVKNLKASNVGFAARMNGKLVGFLIGNIPATGEKSDFCLPDIRKAAEHIDTLWLSRTLEEERHMWEKDWFAGEKACAEKAPKSKEGQATRMELFVVKSDLKGAGIGSELYSAFERLHLEANPRMPILLNTDTWCGYRFYEKRGFRKVAEVPVYDNAEAKKTQSPVGAFFLYGKFFD